MDTCQIFYSLFISFSVWFVLYFCAAVEGQAFVSASQAELSNLPNTCMAEWKWCFQCALAFCLLCFFLCFLIFGCIQSCKLNSQDQAFIPIFFFLLLCSHGSSVDSNFNAPDFTELSFFTKNFFFYLASAFSTATDTLLAKAAYNENCQ